MQMIYWMIFVSLNECGQIALAGCQYACSVNINTDERTTFESIRVGLEILRETLSPQVKGFFSGVLISLPVAMDFAPIRC